MKKEKIGIVISVLMLSSYFSSFALEKEISKSEYIEMFLEQKGELEEAPEFAIPGPYSDVSNSTIKDRMINYFYYSYLMQKSMVEESSFNPDSQFSYSDIKLIEGEYGRVSGDYDAVGEENNIENTPVESNGVDLVYPLSDRAFAVRMKNDKIPRINDINITSSDVVVDDVYDISDTEYIVMLEGKVSEELKFKIFEKQYSVNMMPGTVYGAKIKKVTTIDTESFLVEFDKEISPEGLAAENFIFDKKELASNISYLKIRGEAQRRYLVVEKQLSAGVHGLMISGVLDDFGNVNISSGENRNINVSVRPIEDTIPPKIEKIEILDDNHIKIQFSDISSISKDTLETENIAITDELGTIKEIKSVALEPNYLGVENIVVIEFEGDGKGINLAMKKTSDSFGNDGGAVKLSVSQGPTTTRRNLVSAKAYNQNKIGLKFNGAIGEVPLDCGDISISQDIQVLRVEKDKMKENEIIVYTSDLEVSENYKITLKNKLPQKAYSGNTYVNYQGEKNIGLILESVLRTDVDNKTYVDVAFSHKVDKSSATVKYKYYIEGVGFANLVIALSEDIYRIDFDGLNINDIYELRVSGVESSDGKTINEDYNKIMIK